MVVALQADNKIRVFDFAANSPLGSVDTGAHNMHCDRSARFGLYAVALTEPPCAVVYSDTLVLTRSIKHSHQVTVVRFLRLAAQLVSGDRSGLVILSDLANNSCVSQTHLSASPISDISISPTDSQMLVSSLDGRIYLAALPSLELLRTFSGHTKPARCIADLPCGTAFVSGSNDGTIKVWSVATGQVLKTLQYHRASVLSLATNMSAGVFASASMDGNIGIWDCKLFTLISKINCGETVYAIAFVELAGVIVAGVLKTGIVSYQLDDLTSSTLMIPTAEAIWGLSYCELHEDLFLLLGHFSV
jgi:WD40 repeat protein